MTPPFHVRPVESRSDRNLFVDLPYRLYRGNDYWVPQLRADVKSAISPRKNPFFEHGEIQPFLAIDDKGNVVGRIAGIVNGMHLKKYDDGLGFFGFFECEEHPDIAAALLKAVDEWIRAKGLRGVRGPTNPSMNDVAGMLVDGFHRRPSIMMPYNPPFYETYLLQSGFSRVMTMWAYYIHEAYADMDRFRRGVSLVRRRNPGIRLRTIDMSRYYEEARTILHIYNAAWADNWGNVPMTDAEFHHLAKEMRPVLDPNIVYILEKDGEPIAFSVSLPDINQALIRIKDGRLLPFGLLKLLFYSKVAGINECRTILQGVLPPYQGRGLDALMHGDLVLNHAKYGYVASEISWVLATNKRMVNTAESLGGAIRSKEYAMFEKQLA